jgi:hypothetical protein
MLAITCTKITKIKVAELDTPKKTFIKKPHFISWKVRTTSTITAEAAKWDHFGTDTET